MSSGNKQFDVFFKKARPVEVLSKDGEDAQTVGKELGGKCSFHA